MSLYISSQVRQGIVANTKGTAFVVYEDILDAKLACETLNGFNFQNRYLVGTSIPPRHSASQHLPSNHSLTLNIVLFHRPEMIAPSKVLAAREQSLTDIAARQESLTELKKKYDID